MSSFKRRTPQKAPSTKLTQDDANSARYIPGNINDQVPGTCLLSGLSSIDDILGSNGIPAGHVLLIRTPDPHSAWGSMISRYSISQGLVSGNAVVVVAEEEDAQDLVSGCMWTSDALATESVDPDEADPETQTNESIKIAWRYEKMKQFSTTVPKRAGGGSLDQESANFDLTMKIPAEVLEHSRTLGQLVTLPLVHDPQSSINGEGHKNPTQRAIRIIIPDLGDSNWGDLRPNELIRFLWALRGVIRGALASAFVTLSSTVSGETWGGHGWTGKLSHVSDGCITLAGFGDDPLSSLSFANHHGLVKVSSSPSPGTLRAPSIARSILRGMTSSGPHGGGENNLAFRCTRRRLVIETMHLGAEGGIGARQTSAPTNAEPSFDPIAPSTQPAELSKPARVTIGFDTSDAVAQPPDASAKEAKGAKAKPKRVLFQHDKPEIYDF